MKKKTIIILLAVGAAGAGLLAWDRARSASSEAAPALSTAGAERGPIVLQVSTTGRVVANLDVAIKCKASGEAVLLPFDVSDPVKKGDLLVQLDPTDEERNAKQAELSLSAYQAKLAKAQRELLVAEKRLATENSRAEAALKAVTAHRDDARAKARRVKELLDKKLASEEDAETAETAAVQAEADLKNASIRIEELKVDELALDVKREDVRLAATDVERGRIALSDAQQRLKETKVMAPMDGVVSSREVQTGQIISSAISNVGGGTTLLTLSDLSRLFVLASVDESDIGKVALEQPVTITADAFPEERFRGKVVRIATRGLNTSGVVTFEVKIEVQSRNKSLLRPEMTTNVEIIAASKEDVLLVPNEAVSRKRGQPVCQVAQTDGTTEERPVEVGLTDGVNTEVTAGLTEGERVVLPAGKAESQWRREGNLSARGMMRATGARPR